MTRTVNVSAILTPYLAGLKNYKVLTREEEVEFFQRIDAEEDAFIIQLASDKEIFQKALAKAMEKVKGERDPECDKLLNALLNAKNGLPNLFKEYCRKDGKVRSVQENIYHYIEKEFPNCEFFPSLQLQKKKLQIIRNEFAKHNLRLVISLAKKYSTFSSNTKITDLIQEGNMGLLKAIDKFDSSRELKFSTYASWWIKQNMRRSIHDKDKTVRLPVHISENFYKVKSISTLFLTKHGREPTESELVKETGLKKNLVKFIKENGDLINHASSLDKPYGGDDSFTMLDTMSGNELSAEDSLCKQGINEALKRAIDCLSTKEAFIIRNRFDNELTLEEIGQKYNVSRERIRQIEAVALRKLKNNPNLKRHVHSLFFK